MNKLDIYIQFLRRQKFFLSIYTTQQVGLTWTHASVFKFWNNEAAALYSVQSIPVNLFIDPQGNIGAKDIKGRVNQSFKKAVKIRRAGILPALFKKF